jgi:hypothetical protein
MLFLNQTPTIQSTPGSANTCTCNLVPIFNGLNIYGDLKGNIPAVGTTPSIVPIQISGYIPEYGSKGTGEYVLPILAAGGVAMQNAIGIGEYGLPSVVVGGVAYSTPNGIAFPLLEVTGRAKYGTAYEFIPMVVSGSMSVFTPPLHIGITLPILHVVGKAVTRISMSGNPYILPRMAATGTALTSSPMRGNPYKFYSMTATGRAYKTISATGVAVLPMVRVSGTAISPPNIAVLPRLSFTGTLAKPKFYQGDMVLRRLNISGVAIIDSVYTLFKPVVHAALQTAFTRATGEYQLHAVTVTGSATHYVAAGAYTLPKLNATGTASQTVNLSATIQLPKVGVQGSFGWGAAITLPKVRVSTAVTIGRTVGGVYVVPKVRASGIAVAAQSAPGLVHIYKPKVYGVMVARRSTIGVYKFKAMRATGTIKVGKALTASYPLPKFKVVGRAVSIPNVSIRYTLRKVAVKGAMIWPQHT